VKGDMKKVTLQFCHPPQSISGNGDYMRILVQDSETGEEEVIFTGKRWAKINDNEKEKMEM
jgi:hypothetical protein